jgi:hypothetical protein
MKKILLKLLAVTMLTMSFNSFGPVYAENEAYGYEVESSVKINDLYLYADTPHLLAGDTVFVVGRYLVEALGGEIEWIEEIKTVRMTLNEKVIEIAIGSVDGEIDGNDVELYKAPYIKDDRTMIPLRFVSENFGCQVSWDQGTYTVNITNENGDIPEDYVYDRAYTDEDLYLLSKIVTVESGDTSLEMAMAIANTILNRVKDDSFPGTIEEVIYQVDEHVQFPPAHKETFESLQPKPISIAAAKKALEGINNIGDSLYFNNQPFASKVDDFIDVIDGEYFYR